MDETSTASIFASSTSRVLLSLLSLKYMGSREDEHILALEIRCQCRFQRLPQIFDFRLAQFHFLVLNRHPIVESAETTSQSSSLEREFEKAGIRGLVEMI